MPRYSDLIAQIPTGTFYSSQGSVVANLDHPYPMRLDSLVANDIYGVFVNNVYQFEITTDADGVAIFNLSLPKGENVVKLVNRYSQTPTTTYLTVRDWATWLTAYADQLDIFDTNIDTIKKNSRMAEVNYEMADPVWGSRLLTNNSPSYPIDTYREVLQQVQQGYRRFGGIIGGLDETVAAFTQVNPWMCTTKFGPQWELGTDFITNSDLTGYTYGLFSTPWPEMDPVHPGNVTIQAKSYAPVATAIPAGLKLTWDSSSRRFTYTDDVLGPAYCSATSGYVPTMGVFNETLEARFITNELWSARNNGWDTTDYHWLAFDFGNGQININIDPGSLGPAITTGAIVTAITNAIAADPRYNGAGISVTSQFGGLNLLIVTALNTKLMPPVDTFGEPVNDAAWMIWGIPWIQATPSSDVFITPPSTTDVQLDFSNQAVDGFPTPTYPGAYSLSMLYEEDISGTMHRLSLPVVAVNKSNDANPNTIVVDFTPYQSLPTGWFRTLNNLYPTSQTAYSVHGKQVVSKLTINIADTSLLPTTVTTTNNFVPFAGEPGVPPDGWYQPLNGAGNPDVILNVVDGWLQPSTLMVRSNSGTAVWTITTQVDPNLRDWAGFVGEYGCWVSIDPTFYVGDVNIITTLEFISYATGVASSYTRAATLQSETDNKPVQIGGDIIVPAAELWDYAQLSISMDYNIAHNVNDIEVRVDRAYLKLWTHTGLNLGFNTVPRNAKRAERGYMLYAWCPDPLLASEKTLLGLPQFYDADNIDPPFVTSLADLRAISTLGLGVQSYAVVDTSNIYQYNPDVGANEVDNGNGIIKPNDVAVSANGRWYLVVYPTGHISTVSPSQVTIDRFDISKYGNDSNITGVFTDTDFFNCIIADPLNVINLDVVSRAPSRFSYLMPNAISAVVGEVVYPTINLDPITSITSPFMITFGVQTPPLPNIIWDQLMDTVVLYEDLNTGNGPIPIPHDVLADLSTPGISVIGLNFTPVNGATYSIDYQRLTQFTTTMMTLPGTFLNYQWWADWVTFRILDMVPHTISVYTGVQFDGNYYANIAIRSNMDVASSLLLRDDGTKVEPIPVTQWGFINNNTIRIAPQAFDAISTYTLQYKGRVINPYPIPQVMVEIAQPGINGGAWRVLPKYNTVVPTQLNQLDPPVDIYQDFQMRMTITNITDIRFIRIYSMLLKGIPVNWWGNKFIDHSMDPLPPPPGPG